MKRGLILSFVTVGLVVLCGSWTAAIPDDNRSDFALFDGTNPANQATGAVCGVRTAGKAFTFYVTVTVGTGKSAWTKTDTITLKANGYVEDDVTAP